MKTGLSWALPRVPGKLLWLCTECEGNFQLVTLVSNREKPEIRRERLSSSLPSATQEEVTEGAGAAAPETQETHNSNQEPGAIGEDCPLYLEGKCPSRISGKKGGACSDRHLKICPKFMRLGDKGGKGDKGDKGDKGGKGDNGGKGDKGDKCCNGGCHKLHPALCHCT